MGQKPLEIAPADSVAAAVLSAKRDASNIPKGVLAKTSGVSPTRLRSILDAKRPMRRSWVCRGGWCGLSGTPCGMCDAHHPVEGVPCLARTALMRYD